MGYGNLTERTETLESLIFWVSVTYKFSIYKTLIVYTHNKSSRYSFILGYPLSSVKILSFSLSFYIPLCMNYLVYGVEVGWVKF